MSEEASQRIDPLVSGVEIVRCLTFLQEQGGRPALDAVVRRLRLTDLDCSAEDLLQPARSYTQADWLQIMQACQEVSGDPRFFFHLGARHTPEHFKVFSAQWPTRPEHMFWRIPKTSPASNEWEVEASWISEAVTQSALVRWRSDLLSTVPVELRVPWIRARCQLYQGMFSTLPTQANLLVGQPAAVYEVRCLAEGAEWCEWQFSWQQPRLLYKREIRNSLAWWLSSLLSICILLFASWQLPQNWWVFNLIVALLPLGLVFLYQRMRRSVAAAEELARAAGRAERSLSAR